LVWSSAIICINYSAKENEDGEGRKETDAAFSDSKNPQKTTAYFPHNNIRQLLSAINKEPLVRFQLLQQAHSNTASPLGIKSLASKFHKD
jgi:hypothetical protein